MPHTGQIPFFAAFDLTRRELVKSNFPTYEDALAHLAHVVENGAPSDSVFAIVQVPSKGASTIWPSTVLEAAEERQAERAAQGAKV